MADFSEALKTASNLILGLLSKEPRSAFDLRKEATDAGNDPKAVRTALWDLLESREIELRADLKLAARPPATQAAAS